ncbi:MAG: hypothetical protein HY650_05040 [Acidobacteria bacterium]|nr:hypothetical protein [Acidobacteriota bacterium]
MSEYDIDPIDLSRLRTYPLASRESKVSVADLGKPSRPGISVHEWLSTLPQVLAAGSIKSVARAVVDARSAGRPVIAGFGGHVIKVGLAPLLIDLMRRGFITGFATTGSGVIHDFEIALAGSTSEDVDASLSTGGFGTAEETGRLINQAIDAAAEDGCGIGEGVGRVLRKMNPPYAASSLLCCAHERKVPLTVHVTIGADITHIHPAAHGGPIGETSHRDFRLFCAMVRELDDGGVYLNLGSAVTLPEVFLKAVTVVRNLGSPLKSFTTANFDFVQHYRPLTNVVRRPVEGVGRSYALTGHHELMIPLLAAIILDIAVEAT